MALAQIILMLPAMLVAAVAVFGLLAYELGLPGGYVGAYFLHDADGLLISMIVYVLAIVTVPPVLRALSDPEWAKLETRLAVWAFAACLPIPLSHVLPDVVNLLQSFGIRTTSPPITAIPSVVRFAPQPRSSIPSPGFFSRACPQLE